MNGRGHRALAASLAVNVALGAAVALARGPIVQRVRAIAGRRTPKDFAGLAADRFAGWSPAATVLVGDSQIELAPLPDLLDLAVRARGIGGARIGDVAQWVDGVLADSPQRVVLFVGSNDAYFRVPFVTSAAAASSLFERLRGVPVVSVVGVPPVAGRAAEVAALNAELARLAARYGVDFVDLHAALAGVAWSHDGLHLNSAAYRVLAGLLQLR